MKIFKKYTAIQLSTETVNDKVNVKLSYGEITGPFYSQDKPTEEFDTEQEATEYAYKTNKYRKWLIVPVVRFSIWEEDEDVA